MNNMNGYEIVMKELLEKDYIVSKYSIAFLLV